jgi:hypothetical protein
MTRRDDKHQFRVGGYEFSLTREKALEKLATIKAGDIEEIRKYYVEDKGRRIPICRRSKQ